MPLEPYQFEPRKKSNDKSDDDSWEDVTTDEEETEMTNDETLMTEKLDRLKIPQTEWCKCEYCTTMPVSKECLCCTEIPEIMQKNLSAGIKCITLHEAFIPAVLNKYVLWGALVSLHDRESAWLPPEDNVPNKSYRYAAYRQFCWVMFSKLGRYVRRVLPACVVSKIRETYPEATGVYVNFSGDDDGADAISETETAWQF